MTYGPIQTNANRLNEMTAEHLETRALSASVKAGARMAELFSLIAKLAPQEQEEVRLSMKAGLKRAAGENSEVESWASHNKVKSQMTIAWEATEWSASQIKCEEPESRRKQFLKIAEVAHKVWKAHCSATDCVSELLSRGGARAANLWVSLNVA